MSEHPYRTWVIIGICSFVGVVLCAESGVEGIPVLLCFLGSFISVIVIIIKYIISVVNGTKKAIKKAGNFVSDVQKAVHNVANGSSLIRSVDNTNLLDLTKKYYEFEYSARVRVIPILTCVFGKESLIDIRENKKEIDEYSIFVIEVLKKNGLSTYYADIFLKDVIQQVYSKSIDWKLEKDSFDFIKNNNISNEDCVNVMIPSILMLTNRINHYFCFKINNFFSKFGLSIKDVENAIVGSGYSKDFVAIPQKTVYTVDDYEDLLDFSESPIDYLYSSNGRNNHMNFCRVIPAVALMALRKGNIEVKQEDKSEIENYKNYLKENVKYFPRDSVDDFVDKTIEKCMKITDPEGSIRNNISEYLKTLENNELLDLIQKSLGITSHINQEACLYIYEMASERISVDMLNEIIKKAGYENFYFDPTSIKKTKDESVYFAVLGLQKGASISDIKKAYRRLSLKFHPDAIADKKLDEAFIEFAQNKFNEINEAYNYLKEKYEDQSQNATVDTTTSYEDFYGVYESDASFVTEFYGLIEQSMTGQELTKDIRNELLTSLNNSLFVRYTFMNNNKVKMTLILPDFDSDDWSSKRIETNITLSYTYDKNNNSFETEPYTTEDGEPESVDKGYFSDDFAKATILDENDKGRILVLNRIS